MMQKQAWSVSALAVELGIDRRTIAKKLDWAGIQPIDEVNGSRKYRLADVVNALQLREPKMRADSAKEEREWSKEWGYSSEIMAVRYAFIYAEPAALFLIRHTRMSPEQVLSLIPELWTAFEEQGGSIFKEPKILGKLPLNLRGKERRVLLDKLKAERLKALNK